MAQSDAVDFDFNPRSSCEERLSHIKAYQDVMMAFQSTLLMRGATTSRTSSITTW